MALTSEACLKGLPKTAAGEVVAFKGWPKLQWFVTEHLTKTPKDWAPTPRLTDDTPAYIEVSLQLWYLSTVQGINKAVVNPLQ